MKTREGMEEIDMAEVMLERIVPWSLNGVPQASFLCTPDALQELVYGHLIAQGRVSAPAEILSITGDEHKMEAQVAPAELRSPDIMERLNSAPVQAPGFTIPMAQIRAMIDRLLSSEDYYGTHRLMLACESGEVYREDVGRHNAADKVIGYALQHGWALEQCVMGSTGRISLEMLAKAATCRIPVFFSRKYPSDLSIEWAKKLGIALIGKAHTDQPQIAGATWRIKA